MHELLPLADLMLMPSELESFGLAALEAMACKVPAIATRVGGVPELIDDGVTGLLYPVGDVDAMAAGAVSLLKDRDRLEAMRRQGARRLRIASARRWWCRIISAITSRCWGMRAEVKHSSKANSTFGDSPASGAVLLVDARGANKELFKNYAYCFRLIGGYYRVEKVICCQRL